MKASNVLAAAALCTLVAQAQAQTTLQFDFGINTQETTTVGWNNVSGPVPGAPVGIAAGGVVDNTGAATGFGVDTTAYGTDQFHGVGGVGSNWDGPYPAGITGPGAETGPVGSDMALRDSLYFRNLDTPSLSIISLPAGSAWDMTFYGARGNNGDMATYTVTGTVVSMTSIANVFSNSTTTATLMGVVVPASGELVITCSAVDLAPSGSLNALVMTSGVSTQTGLCNGDGGNQMGCTNCPCANNATPGATGGCLNSAGTGAQLIKSGDPSLSLPSGSSMDLRFALSGAPPTAFCILNSGDAVAPGNMANPCFGLNSGAQATAFDGLRCAITNTRRHGGRSADATGEIGTTNSPWGGEGGPPVGIGNAGAGFTAGQTRYFQVVNRDDPLFVCMRGLNTSQAIEVTFTP